MVVRIIHKYSGTASCRIILNGIPIAYWIATLKAITDSNLQSLAANKYTISLSYEFGM